MSLDSISVWLISFLRNRGEKQADGRMLFSYNLSQVEYVELRHEMSQAISKAGGIDALAALSLGKARLGAPPAAFVLYASEWWKRDYAGGVWDWSPIIESLGGDPRSFLHEQQLRSQFVARGLAFWRLSPLDKGKRFIGSIVVNGGIPMRLLAHGSGPVAMVLSQVLKQAGRYRWGHTQILEAVSERLVHLPSAYRRPEIAELLSQFVVAALQLKDEYQLEGVADPLGRLGKLEPGWQRRFPVSLESEAAQSLLSGLVQEAASKSVSSGQGLFVAERRLVCDPVSGHYAVESHIAYPSRIEAEDLASMFGLKDVEDVPRYFTIDLEADTRQPFIEGRLVLGSEKSVATLTGRKTVVRGHAAASELQLIMRSPVGDQGEPPTLEGGSTLPDEDPWVFVEGEAGYSVLAAVGGAKLPHQYAWVALPSGWSIDCATEPEAVGELVCPGYAPRQIFSIRSDARLMVAGITYRVRLGQVSHQGQIYLWKAQRLPEARGRSIFRDRQTPRLFRGGAEGLQAVPQSDQEWRLPGTQEILRPKEARGPVEVRILDDGELVARQRIFVIPPEARIEYISGHAVGVGQVRFTGWGPIDLAPEVAAGVTASISKNGLNSINIELSSVVEPPSDFRIRIRWTGTASELSLILPYPVTGGRFLRADGTVMQANETVTLRDLVGMRLQIFDTNTAHPKRYDMQLALERRDISSRHPINLPFGTGRTELRLIDYRKQIESLLGLFDDLDAKVGIGLLVAGQQTCEIGVGRYTCALQKVDSCVQVSQALPAPISAAELDGTRILACSLIQPKADQHELTPVRLEGVHTGSWTAVGMDRKLAPWLLFPTESSAVMFRPLLWAEAGIPIEDGEPFEGNSVSETVGLSDALLQAQEDKRGRQIHAVLQAMSENHLHESWPLMDDLWETFHHLPLPALDIWRMMAKQPKALLSFLLRSQLNDAELAEAIRRFRIETAWVPELTTVSDLCGVAQAFWHFWLGQGLEQGRCHQYFNDELVSRFNLLANEIPSLGPLIETAVFAATGTMSDLLLEVAGPSRKSTCDLLGKLWKGGDSLVNLQLLLVNAKREVPDLIKKDKKYFATGEAWPAFVQACLQPNQKLLEPHSKDLFWKIQENHLFPVANLPVLCALWAATSTSRQFWSDPGSRLTLKQIRDFDPIWFEQAYRQAFKVCMSIDGLVQLPTITDF